MSARSTIPVLAVLLGACGGPLIVPAGPEPVQPAPALPAERVIEDVPAEYGGYISAHARNATVRPAQRDFSTELMRQLRLPPGFSVAVFAQDLEEPRVIVAAPNGRVYVSERSAGRVRLLEDTDGDGRADVARNVLAGLREDLRGVHGLALHGEHLYMATETELLRARIRDNGDLDEPEHLQDIPAGGQHPNRTIAVAPDGTLFLSIGSTCNACVEPTDDHAALHRVTAGGSERELFASGLRNTVGFGWHPATGQLWGLDHNSDGRGDEWPPEELNRIEQGRHYGWPFCGGERQPDHQVPADPAEPREMTKQEFCATTAAPTLTYTAHAAPMQLLFYTGTQFPAEFRNSAFVTMRGSWNRSRPAGFEVVRIRFDDAGNPIAFEPFVTGWLIENGRAHFGRVMGLAQTPDGALLIGDDANGVIYRVTYGGSES